jgi:ParB family chromosome partitioning protein
MAPAKIRSLGRGLSALIGDNYSKEPSNSNEDKVVLLDLEQITTNIHQPRKNFSSEALEELANSIKEKGVIVPILVKKDKDNQYIIIAGERRYRACKLAGIKQIPVIIKDIDEVTTKEYSIIENVQRQDLTAIEEAFAYRDLINDYNYTQQEVAKTIGKSRSHVANLLRLLSLPEEVQELIMNKSISMGHARALITAKDPLKAAKAILSDGLNVRQTEQFAIGKVKTTKPKTSAKVTSEDKVMLEEALSAQLGMKVTIDLKEHDKGIVSLHYNSFEELDRILQLLPSKEKKQ